MNYTNLNIISEGKSFKYIVEYYDDPTLQSVPMKYYKNEDGIFFVNKNHVNMIDKKNYWLEEYDKSTSTHKETLVDTYVPGLYNKSSFNIYFPRFSVETYERNVKYVLTINTWINGVYVYLCSILLDRSQAKACESGVKKFLNQEYYEYIHIDTIDPTFLVYDDEWKDFRVNVCGERITSGVQANNTASNLNFTITPVKLYDDTWMKFDRYDSSQSAILLNNSCNNYMKNNLYVEMIDGEPVLHCNISYNSVYSSLKEYLLETYQIDTTDYTSKYLLLFRDKDNAYKYIEHVYTDAHEADTFAFNEIKFTGGWNDYVKGMTASTVFILSKDDVDIVVLSSNNLMINEELFKYLICDAPIKKLNFEAIDMTTNEFDVVNIIEHKVIQVERPEDYKANIVKPVFVKVQEAGNIRLHPLVTENIVINLDAYKNKVDAFTLKIDDSNFYEVGRINSGIVFKIVGSNLDSEKTDGIYYILNNDGELVTTGKYVLA